MKKILVENKYGHGAKRKLYTVHWLQRKLRPQLGKAEIPFDWTKPIALPNLEIKNQFQSDSCGGQAGSYFIGERTGTNISAKSIYAPIADAGGGTTINQLETQLCAKGANLESTVPSQYAGGGCDETFMTDLSWQTLALSQDAITRAGYTPYSVNIDINSMAEAIRDYGGIIIQIEGQNNGTWLSPNPQPPISNQNLWGHFMYGGGTTTNQLAFFQSWGNTVGNNGIQYFDNTYINSGYIVDCFTLIPDSKITSLPSNMPIWQGLAEWFNEHL